MRYDSGPRSSLPQAFWYLEVRAIIGSHRFISPFDRYDSLMGRILISEEGDAISSLSEDRVVGGVLIEEIQR